MKIEYEEQYSKFEIRNLNHHYATSVHFVLAAFVAIVWCFERIFVKTAPGRFRLNVIGAIHATS